MFSQEIMTSESPHIECMGKPINLLTLRIAHNASNSDLVFVLQPQPKEKLMKYAAFR